MFCTAFWEAVTTARTRRKLRHLNRIDSRRPMLMKSIRYIEFSCFVSAFLGFFVCTVDTFWISCVQWSILLYTAEMLTFFLIIGFSVISVFAWITQLCSFTARSIYGKERAKKTSILWRDCWFRKEMCWSLWHLDDNISLSMMAGLR